MNDHELEAFEAELKRARPARLPQSLATRLRDAQPSRQEPVTRSAQSPGNGASADWITGFRTWLRWLAPAAAVLIAGLWIWRSQMTGPETAGSTDLLPIAVTGPALTADDVLIDQHLVSTFDAIAELPNGEPLRVRCEEWVDDVTLRDVRTGLAVQKKTPRFEIVGVRYDTY